MFSMAGMIVLDYRFKLLFFSKPIAAIKSIVISTSLLLFIDIIGVNWKIFTTNQSYVIGLGLGSENIPIEELIFLIFINYFILCIYQIFTIRQNDV